MLDFAAIKNAMMTGLFAFNSMLDFESQVQTMINQEINPFNSMLDFEEDLFELLEEFARRKLSILC